MRIMPARSPALVAIAFFVFLTGCVHVFRTVRVEEVTGPATELVVRTPLKAHLIGGQVVVFADGAVYSIESRVLSGAAVMYELDLSTVPVNGVAVDSIAAMETFDTDVQEFASVLATAGATAVGVFATAAAAVAIFGSCPTVYADGHLEAETFSNSISRLMEVRDVDRLEAQPDSSGRLHLEFRNEALETHYINHLEMLSATHSESELAVPRRDGTALVLGDLRSPRATSRTGSNVSTVLRHQDGVDYRTEDRLLASVAEGDIHDYIDLTIPRPASDTAGVLVRGRTSLLTTVLLYDFMLGQGPSTLDYTGVSLESISEAMALGSLFRDHMGIRVYVFDDGSWERVGRIGTSGPVAWETTGIGIPVPPGDSLRVRLEFLADSWRFDQVLVAGHVREVDVSRAPAIEIGGYSSETNMAVRTSLAGADDNYHITFPGQSFTVTFAESPPLETGTVRSYFLAAQGYYTEWIRKNWFDRPATRFEVNDRILLSVLREWRERRSWYESTFYSSRIPVRGAP